jgi:hypothetical protein
MRKGYVTQVDSILASSVGGWREKWIQIDGIVLTLPTEAEQQAEWERIVTKLKSPSQLGHAYFRLAVLHLLRDNDEKQAISLLEDAYHSDCDNATPFGRPPQTLSAYRLLAFIKGFFEYLDQKRNAKNPNWEAEQFQGAERRGQIETLLVAYDASLVHPLDSAIHTFQSFFQIMTDKQLTQFAIENYFCAEEMLVEFTLEGRQALRMLYQYPYARALVGLLGGVLEAIVADAAGVRGLTLGGTLSEAYNKRVIKRGSQLAALGSLMLYLRNHIHADRAVSRTQYFIDLSVAKGFKAALDSVITHMVSVASAKTSPPSSAATHSTPSP